MESKNDSTGEPARTALLTQYREVRSELREILGRLRQRALAGVGVVGAIIGYALSTDTHLLLLAIPFLIGYVYAASIHSGIVMMYLAKHSRDIEDSITEDKFSWESKYGGIWEDTDRDVPANDSVNWNEIPKFAVYGFFIVGYLASIGVALFIAVTELASDLLIAFCILTYLILTLIVLAVTYSYYQVAVTLNDRV